MSTIILQFGVGIGAILSLRTSDHSGTETLQPFTNFNNDLFASAITTVPTPVKRRTGNGACGRTAVSVRFFRTKPNNKGVDHRASSWSVGYAACDDVLLIGRPAAGMLKMLLLWLLFFCLSFTTSTFIIYR